MLDRHSGKAMLILLWEFLFYQSKGIPVEEEHYILPEFKVGLEIT